MKIKILISLLMASVIFANAQAFGTTYRTTVDHAISKLNIAITHPETDEKYLLYLDSGCNKMRDGQTIQLSIQGSLNGAGDDLIRLGDTESCKVVRVTRYTHRAFVRFTYRSNTQARVYDENDKEFTIYYPDSCSAVQAFTRDYVYLEQGGNEISTGDRLILPKDNGECSISFVRSLSQENTEPVEPAKKAPAAVYDVKAFPRNGAVFLDWNPAKESNIDYYKIAVMRGKVDTRDVPLDEVADTLTSRQATYMVNDLVNEQTYYFYVKAVNKEGLESSDWSVVASATPQSSIINRDPDLVAKSDLDLRIKSDTSFAYVIDWTPIVTADRYTVILEEDGVRQWVKTDYLPSYVRILKRSYRKGKKLKIIVRAYLPKDFVEEQEIEFGFD